MPESHKWNHFGRCEFQLAELGSGVAVYPLDPRDKFKIQAAKASGQGKRRSQLRTCIAYSMRAKTQPYAMG
jgi:hypothetical protein